MVDGAVTPKATAPPPQAEAAQTSPVEAQPVTQPQQGAEPAQGVSLLKKVLQKLGIGK